MLNITKAGNHGILLPELGIGLDYKGTQASHIFISHAHSDHMPTNRKLKVFASPATAKLMKLRGFLGEIVPVEFGQPVVTEQARITLFPAGHILGSAMTFVESEFGTVLYTGDYRIPPSPASEGFQLPEVPVHHFITEATFSLPIYKWKSNVELATQIRSFARNTLNEEGTPVFLAYNLGKAQEIMVVLSELNHPVQIHKDGFKLCPVYEEMGFNLGSYEVFNPNTCQGKILIVPKILPELSNQKQIRIAYCSGWASNGTRYKQSTADVFIPLSDHLDFFELLKVCERLNPKKVWLTHTPNPEVVQYFLTRKGIPSEYLTPEA